MLSVNNILAPKDGSPITSPTQDMILGAYYLTLGVGRVCGGSIAQALKRNPPDYVAACTAIKLYNRAHGKILRGLVIRRENEYQMCMGGSS